jgi:D-amino-acid dehydrogenase
MKKPSWPIIDRVAGASNVLVATGHGQLGVTTAATTARLIAARVSGRAPLLDLKPYRIDRFSAIS